ncbi:MAG: excinuclease ABC subunit UvrC [Candidatus Gracilibacteria bacterium]|nr:excinuclease ABC subunit UvrC [Candidatus Gracilibacteria bacterium]MDD5179144.1 excinuclease ABC subunit UvrC [Candidatus Gracilibacteria bacterium]
MNAISNLLRKLPDSPGVYQFLDKEGKIIYIGKAKNLKNRVKNYFQKGSDKSPKTERMVEVATDLKWIETSSEVEALTLESNLVREFQPKFNVLLRDDKHFLYFKVTLSEDFPRLLTSRKVENDGNKYFGPKTDSKALQNTLKLAQKLFRIRVCNLEIEAKDSENVVTHKTIKFPCIYKDILLCSAPCVGNVSREEYSNQVKQLCAFLAGDTSAVVKDLHSKMIQAAQEKKFELATQLRNQIQSIESIGVSQLASTPDLASRDVVGIKIDFGKAYLAVLKVRNGKLIDSKNFTVKTGESEISEILSGFLIQYFEIETDCPKEILLPAEISESELIEKWLCEKCGGRVKILFPQKGMKENFLRLAEKNAAAYAIQSKAKYENATEKTVGAAAELAKQLNISRELKRIEAYDISHFSGDAMVGSMVVFEKGEPVNSAYRQFKIRSLKKGEVDDYKALSEVLGRRMRYLTPQLPKNAKIRRGGKKDEKPLDEVRFRDYETGELIDDIKDYFLVEIKGEIVARMKMIFWKKEKVWGIYSVWVDEKFRGKELGLTLIEKALQIAKPPKVYLNCKKELVEYYNRIGFQEIREAPKFFDDNFREWCKRNPEFIYEEFVYMMREKKTQKVDASFAAKPDLVILDGGKGQLSVVSKEVNFPKTTSVVGLAKREEEIFRIKDLTVKKLAFERILLPGDSQALYLVKRIRDEAHRFANSLREKIQTNQQTVSSIDELPGVGEATRKLLFQKFGSVEKIRAASLSELIALLGDVSGKKVYKLLKEN